MHEYDPDETVDIGALRLRFHDVPALRARPTPSRSSSTNGGGPVHVRRRLPPQRRARRVRRATPTCLILEATLPRPERDGPARPPHARRGRRPRPPRRRTALRHHPHLRRDGPALGQGRGGEDVRRAGRRGPGGRAYEVERQRKRRDRATPLLHRVRVLATLSGCLRSATCSPTSSACGARWTSCSATSSSAPGSPSAGAAGSRPRVDVYYADDPPRAVVKAELAGIDPDELALEVQGRELVISGHRRPGESEGRLYQQIEIEHGPFRRIVPLGADVRADEARAVYEDGILRVELPLAQSAGAPRRPCRSRCRRPGASRDRGRSTTGPGPTRSSWALTRAELPAGAPGAAAARDRHLPRHAHAAGRRSGALDRARQRRPRRQPDARDGRQQGPRARDAGPRGALRGRRRRRRRADAQAARRHAADPRPGRAARARRALGHRAALPGRGGRARSPTSSPSRPSSPR